MTGPLARRIAELEGEVALLRGQGLESDGYRAIIRDWKKSREELRREVQLRRRAERQRDEAEAARRDLLAEMDHLANIATRLALVVAKDGDLAHRHTADCHERYVGCLAARVIEERGRG